MTHVIYTLMDVLVQKRIERNGTRPDYTRERLSDSTALLLESMISRPF